MKILKPILIGLAVVISLPLIVALFVKKNYSVEKSVIIKKPVATVFEYLKMLKNQDEFSKWATIDPSMKKSFRGVDGTVGFVSRWESENPDVGTGEQEIKAIQEGKRIDYELRFIKPFNSVSPVFIQTDALSDSTTKVIWGFEGHLDFPMNLTLLFIDLETAIGNDFQTGLDNLMTKLERE